MTSQPPTEPSTSQNGPDESSEAGEDVKGEKGSENPPKKEEAKGVQKSSEAVKTENGRKKEETEQTKTDLVPKAGEVNAPEKQAVNGGTAEVFKCTKSVLDGLDVNSQVDCFFDSDSKIDIDNLNATIVTDSAFDKVAAILQGSSPDSSMSERSAERVKVGSFVYYKNERKEKLRGFVLEVKGIKAINHIITNKTRYKLIGYHNSMSRFFLSR